MTPSFPYALRRRTATCLHFWAQKGRALRCAFIGSHFRVGHCRGAFRFSCGTIEAQIAGFSLLRRLRLSRFRSRCKNSVAIFSIGPLFSHSSRSAKFWFLRVFRPPFCVMSFNRRDKIWMISSLTKYRCLSRPPSFIPARPNSSCPFFSYRRISPCLDVFNTFLRSRFWREIGNAIAAARKIGKWSFRPATYQMDQVTFNLLCLFIRHSLDEFMARNINSLRQHDANDVILMRFCQRGSQMHVDAITASFPDIEWGDSVLTEKCINIKIVMLSHLSLPRKRHLARGLVAAGSGDQPPLL